jgi:hypothetical protein
MRGGTGEQWTLMPRHPHSTTAGDRLFLTVYTRSSYQQCGAGNGYFFGHLPIFVSQIFVEFLVFDHSFITKLN